MMPICRILPIVVLLLLGACQSNTPASDASNTATTSTTPPPAAATTTTDSRQGDPRAAIAELLRTCSKVEYMVYDAGITFESEGSNEVLRFLSYITNNPPGSGCPSEKYDGNAVFKNAKGEIQFQVQFNLPAVSSCNRVMFKFKDQSYLRTLDQNGIGFFGQVLNMRNQVGQ